MPKQPLAEVFGFPVNNNGREAARSRQHRLCPFGNRVPNCTKDKANDPLGVCSIFDGKHVVITCPIRFRQDWIIAEDAASFFLPPDVKWTTLTEVRLNDKGKVTDFGALEVRAVYISGNVRNPFEYYMQAPSRRGSMDWSERPNYPNPDYLSSSRKRLAPQLIFKGGILRAWNKKIAVALNRGFFETLPKLNEVKPSAADMAWFVYDLKRQAAENAYKLVRHKTVYTTFNESLNRITRSKAGDVKDFIEHLQEKVDEKLEEPNPPDTKTIDELLY